VDLSKAYDTISHERLLDKLRHTFNFTEHTTTFFSTYFRNRQQSTHTQHAQSEFQTITHGIPQGSTLSTTFFLLYINDIIRTVPNSKVYTYADDTTLIITAPTLQDLETLAQSELSNLISYFHANNLVPNPTTTVYSIFYPRRAQPIQLTSETKSFSKNRKPSCSASSFKTTSNTTITSTPSSKSSNRTCTASDTPTNTSRSIP
jgi:hypothetical protein